MVAAVACFVIVIKYLFAFQSYQPYKFFFLVSCACMGFCIILVMGWNGSQLSETSVFAYECAHTMLNTSNKR